MGKGPFSFRRTSSRRRMKKPPHTEVEVVSLLPNNAIDAQSPNNAAAAAAVNNSISAMVAAGTSIKPKKKAGGAKLWMRFDKFGQSELIECDKSMIIKRASIPARDLRILGPIFSHSSNILAREKAMVVNLEFIKAIVTAEEVLLLDPLRQEVLPFVDQLRQQIPHKSLSKIQGGGQMDVQDNEMRSSTGGQWLPVPEAVEGLQCELPFEFQVLEIALEVVCTYLDSSVADLERDAYPVLDELARNVSTKNLEHVRSLKSNLTRLLARVQKVRDEIEHLLDDNEDMAHLYLTRKYIQNQQSEALLGATASNSIVSAGPHLRRFGSIRSASLVSSNYLGDHDVEDLEMLLEAYFMQLDGTRNKILSVREYIDDTEDYVNIQLDNQRNELIQLQLVLTIASFAIAVETLIAGWKQWYRQRCDKQMRHKTRRHCCKCTFATVQTYNIKKIHIKRHPVVENIQSKAPQRKNRHKFYNSISQNADTLPSDTSFISPYATHFFQASQTQVKFKSCANHHKLCTPTETRTDYEPIIRQRNI